MTRKSSTLLPLFALLFAVAVVGCGPDEKTKKIQDLSAENDQLKKEKDDLERQLQEAMVRENDAKGTIDQLNQRLAQMRDQGAKAKDGEWTTFNNFDMMNVPGSVLFESGKAELTSGGRSKLQQIASDIRARYGDRDIYVFGHTDDQPIRKSKWRDNWELGAQRALTVVRSLHESGVPYASLVQANCGEHRPKIPNAGAEKNRSQNRRVEFYAVKRRAGGLTDAAITKGAKSDE
jgi:flagellar motor protein MotB